MAWGRAAVSAASIQPASLMQRNACALVAEVQRDRADFVGAAGVRRDQLTRDVERFLEICHIDDEEAQQLLLGLGERTVDHQRLALRLAERGGGGGRQQPQRGPELARP